LENALRKVKRSGRRLFFDMESLGMLRRLRDRGMSVRAIARGMKESKSFVHNSLKNLNAPAQENQGSEVVMSGVLERGD
jgi:hypothetical protein